MLVDAAQFYVSCERVFQAALHTKPTIVLSNNDGCIVAVSNEAKKLGLKRGQPLFQCQQIIRAHDVQVFSSNYTLYQALSTRMMNVLAELAPKLEVYSIDEAWSELTDLVIEDLTEFARTVKARVYQYIGIPVRVAIAPTKCLTKIACELLKSDEQYGDVLDVTAFTEEQLDQALARVAIEGTAATQKTDYLCKKLWPRDYRPDRAGRSGSNICRSHRRTTARAGLAGRAPHRVYSHKSVCDQQPTIRQ